MKLFSFKTATLILALTYSSLGAIAQNDSEINQISTVVPFLNISPESRTGGMGDAGVATSPDVNSQHINPAKYAFIDGKLGAGISFTPWLRKLVSDINMSYLSGYYRLDDMQTISASLRYFSLGEIQYRQTAEETAITGKPNEFAIDAAYSRKLSEAFSGAVAFRYIRSDFNSYTEGLEAGDAFAADIAFYLKKPIKLSGNDAEFSSGLNVSNIGSKLSYDGGASKEFIPTNMKLGFGLATDIDNYNAISFALDFNKLLVPSSQLVEDRDATEDIKDQSVTSAMFSSFSDAPNGGKEELQEVSISLGAEYLYDKQFAIRAGYFHEHENKGNRKYATAGIGLKFNAFALDASYIIPVVADNPLANTIRFSLLFDLSTL